MLYTMQLSVIIPVLNEEKLLPGLLNFLVDFLSEGIEIIVVDGGSKDDTISIAKSYPVLLLETIKSNRASQLNLGAKMARGEVLYFLHVDTMPPASFIQDIFEQRSAGYESGSYRLQLGEQKSGLLAINSFFTKFRWLIFQGGGDQSLFIGRSTFEKIGGYNDSYVIMEDFDLVRRLWKHPIKTVVMDKTIVVSNRKYQTNAYLKVQMANLIAFSAFKLGVSPVKIKSWYCSMLHPWR